MKPNYGIVLVASTVLAFVAGASEAQTVANGPYYATPSWDQQIPCTTASNCLRFLVLSNWNNEAVLDRETGLVWEKSPSEQLVAAEFDPCGKKSVGNRQGWHLPSVQELRSLIDPSRTSPALPDGHPFTNIHFNSLGFPDFYWTSTEDIRAAGSLKLVAFGAPNASGAASPTNGGFGRSWCVRGGQFPAVQ